MVQNEMLNLSDAAKYLNISKFTLYKTYKSLEIPHVKLGKQIRFPKHLLENWVIDRCNIKKIF